MTVHEQAAERTIVQMLADGGWQAEIVSAAIRAVARGIVSETVIDIMGRPHRPGSRPEQWPAAQLWCIGQAHGAINAGVIGAVAIVVPGGGPQADRERGANQALLDELSKPFTAEVDLFQHGADADGTLRWDEPVVIQQATPPPGYRGKKTPQYVHRNVVVGPGRVPLEIGSTTPSRTLLHLRESGGVARWPYGCDRVYLWLADLDRWAAPQLAASAVRPDDGMVDEPGPPVPVSWSLRPRALA